MDRDLLSFSPSLLDILSFVHPKDILNCRLVSRRFNGVVTRNRKLLRKRSASMSFNTCYTREGIFSCFRVSVSVEEAEKYILLIYDKHTVVQEWHRETSITEYYKEIGIRLEERLFRELANRFRPCFETSTFEQGLRLLLRFFFHKYQYSCIRFGSNCDNDGFVEAFDWSPIVFEEFQQNRTACTQIKLCFWHQPFLHSFYTLGNTQIWVSVKRDIGQLMLEMPSWDRRIGFVVGLDVFKDFGTIINVLKSWESGFFSKIKHVILYQREEKGFTLNSQKVIRLLSCMQCVETKKEQPEGVQGLVVKIYIRRSIDHRILIVLYSKHHRTLSIMEAGDATSQI